MSITASQFVVNSKDTSTFVGVLRYVKTSGVKSSKEGDIYGLLKISSKGAFPAERVAHMAWDGVVDGYMYSDTKSTVESLKNSLEEFTRRLKDLMRNDPNLEADGIDVDLVVVLIKKDGVYIANLGSSDIYTYKNQKIVNISEVLQKNRAKTVGFVVKGEDVLIVSTPGYLSENVNVLIGKKNKKDILSNLDILGKTLTSDQGILYIFDNAITSVEEPLVEDEIEKEVEEVVEVVEKKPVEKKERHKVERKKVEVGKYLLPIISFLKKIGGYLGRFLANILNILKSKLGNQRWFKKILSKMSELNIGKRKYHAPDIRIDGYRGKSVKSKRIKILILSFLAILLIAGGYQYAKTQKHLREISKSANETFDRIDSMLDEATEKVKTDRSSAEMLVFQVGNMFDEFELDLNEKDSQRKDEVLEKFVLVEDELYKRVVVNPESFTTFLDDGSDPSDMKYVVDSRLNEYLIVTDSGTGTVYLVPVFDREPKRMADNNGILKSPEFVDIGSNLDVFVYDSEVGVVRSLKTDTGWGAFEKLTGVSKSNINIGEVSEFARFTTNDNVYYLDRDGNRIARSTNFGGGYSSTVVSVLSHEGFALANDFFADLSIYVLTEGNDGIIRFSQNIEHPISIVGVNGDIGRMTTGDTHNDMNSPMVVFDEGNRRVLVLEKPKDAVNDKLHPNELHLIKQLIYRGDNTDMWSDVKGVSIDREYRNIYILDGNNVWRVGL